MYSASIIGFGGIACGTGAAGTVFPMAHLKTYRRFHDRVDVTSIAEPDPERQALAAKELPDARIYGSVKDLFQNESPNIVSICSPDHLHADHLVSALDVGARAIWCEKPLALSHARARLLLDKTATAGAVVQVNFFRRFIPEIAKLAQEFQSQTFGRILHINAFYPDSFVHNGTHIIDLIEYLAGTLYLDSAIAEDDFAEGEDGPVWAWCRLKDGVQVSIVPVSRDAYNLIEWDFVCEKARIRITESGRRIERHPVEQDPYFPHLRILRPDADVTVCRWDRAFDEAFEDLLGAMESPLRKPLADLSLSLNALALIDQVRQCAGSDRSAPNRINKGLAI